MTATALTGGFADPTLDAARAFRAVMEAMARPGTIRDLPPAAPPSPLSAAAGALVLTLCDADAPLHLAGPCDTPAVRDWVRFHTGAALVGPETAAFVLGPWAALPVARLSVGTPDYPDRAATLIIEHPALAATGVRLTGPGIATAAWLNLPDPAVFAANHARYPLGWDAFLTSGARLAALPRSTRIEV